MSFRHPDCQNCSNGPNVIAISKPGKDASDPAHYRPISLLSVMYKLLQRIQPLIEAATPVYKAGFHKYHDCTGTYYTH
jgi:hypothetical protein